MNSEYERLINLTPQEKHLDYMNSNAQYLSNAFRYHFYNDSDKKLNQSYLVKYEDLVKEEYERNNITPETLQTISGERDLRKFFALEDINLHKSFYDEGAFSKKHFGDIESLEEFANYQLERNNEGIKNLYEKYSPKEIYNFFVKHFGLNFSDGSFSINNDIKEISHSGRPNFGNLTTHITGQRVLKMRNYIHSKVVKIEIVSEEGEENFIHYLSPSEMAGTIKHELGKEPFLVERGYSNKDIFKMYFLFNDYISDEVKSRIEKYFLDTYKFEIKISRERGFWTVPFSKETPLFGSFSAGSPLGINFETLEETYERLLRTFNTNEYKIKKDVLKDILKTDISDKRTLAYTSITGRRVQEDFGKFAYGDGTRHVNQIAIAIRSVANDLSESEYNSLARSLNCGTSKDMKKWSDARIDKTLKGYYEFALGVAQKISPTFKSSGTKNYEIADDLVYTYLDITENKNVFLKAMTNYYDSVYTTKRQQGKWKYYFLEDSLKLFKFILRRMEYIELSGKSYVDERYDELNKGFFIPTNMFSDLKNHLKLKTDIKKLMNSFKKLELIQSIKINNYEYSYKNISYCIHYKVLGEKEFLIKLYNYNNINNKSRVIIKSINYVEDVCFEEGENLEEKVFHPPE